jgi:hypothetical protein
MDSREFDALVASIKAGDYHNARFLFSHCKMIWPNQLPFLLHAVQESKLRDGDLLLHQQISVFISIYADAISGKLQFNDHYLNCFKPK